MQYKHLRTVLYCCLIVLNYIVFCLAKVPLTVRPGTHKLIIEGLVQNPATRAAVISNVSNVFSYESYLPIFHNESFVFFSPKYVSLFVVTDRPAYVVPSSGEYCLLDSSWCVYNNTQ